MAKIKLGAFITDVRGSVGGMTFQGSSSGFILRNKPKYNVSSQRINKSSLSYMSQLNEIWRTLSQSDKKKWQYLATNAPYVSGRKKVVKANGRLYFIAFNMFTIRPWTTFWPIKTSPSGYLVSAPSINPEIYWDGDEYRLKLNQSFTGGNILFSTRCSQPRFTIKPISLSKFYALSALNNSGGAQSIDFFLGRNGVASLVAGQQIWIRIVTIDFVSLQIFSVQYYKFTVPSI